MSTPVLALNNLWIVVVVIVVAVHAVMAYLGSSPASSYKFDDPPYRWRSMPIVDPERWFGFDFFCGFRDIYLISPCSSCPGFRPVIGRPRALMSSI
jgi:hypothetical protein